MPRLHALFLWMRYSAILIAAIIILQAVPASAEDVDCLKCHAGLMKNKTAVHPAVQMGCTACHTSFEDARKVPHKNTSTAPKGLSAEQPDLCYGCHDKAKFTHAVVHTALQMGCSACHDPHGSSKAMLLSADVPELCFNCHDKSEFSRKNVHPPVAGGMCLTCHDPHSSPQVAMLRKPPVELCSECHDQIARQPHAIAGFSQKGHPIGKVRKSKKGKRGPVVADPKRPGKPFSCASCHNPHSSDSPKLFRYPAAQAMDICINCHQF